MASSSSSSVVLAVALLATLFVGAWCGTPFSFKVEKDSSAKKLVLDIKYSKSDDKVKEVELRQHGSEEWMTLKKNGNHWMVESSKPLAGPFNFRLQTEKGSRRVYDEVMPTDFKVGKTYTPE